jgi:hypothetical protein
MGSAIFRTYKGILKPKSLRMAIAEERNNEKMLAILLYKGFIQAH